MCTQGHTAEQWDWIWAWTIWNATPMSITAEHMVFNLKRWNVAQVKAAGTCVWTCSGHSCRWTNRSSEGQLPGSLAPNLCPQAQTSPSPRRAQGLRPAQVQGRVPGLCRLHPRSLWTLNSHNGAVQCEEDLPHAMRQSCSTWWKPGRFPSWRRPIAVTSSAEYLGQVTTPQASVSCPLQREDGTHTSQLVLRRKDSCSRDPQSKAWPDKHYTECCHHWTGRCWSPPLSFHFQTWSQHADNMTRWAGKSWKVSQLWKKERFLGTHNKQETVREHSQTGKMLGTNMIKEKANIFTLFWKLIFINCCIILDSFIFPSFILVRAGVPNYRCLYSLSLSQT